MNEQARKDAERLGRENASICACGEPHMYYCRRECGCPCHDHGKKIQFSQPSLSAREELWSVFAEGRSAALRGQ
jgi:hypothetical protein